jgi:hypothetical protein
LTSHTVMVNVISQTRSEYGGQDKESVSIVWKLVIRFAICGDKKSTIVPFRLEALDRTAENQ